jgi:hypothetical protein
MMKHMRRKLQGLLRRNHTPSQAHVDDYQERVERVRRNSRPLMNDRHIPIKLGDYSSRASDRSNGK